MRVLFQKKTFGLLRINYTVYLGILMKLYLNVNCHSRAVYKSKPMYSTSVIKINVTFVIKKENYDRKDQAFNGGTKPDSISVC